MAMNATLMTDAGGRSSGLGDMDINAESFYIGYKLLGQLNPSLDSLKSDVMSVNESLVTYVGCSFSSVKSKVISMRSELDGLYNNMVNFKSVLEKIDSSNALLFNSIDTQMSGGFGEEMSETDYALMLEELKKVYDEAKKKNPSELTDYEKEVLKSYEPYAKLEDYNSGVLKLEEIEGSLKEKRQALYLCSMSAMHGAGSSANTEKMVSLNKEISELENQKKALSSDNKELRAYLLDKGLVEATGMETIKAAGASLFESGKDAVSAIFSGDKDALSKTSDFITEVGATGAVVKTSIASGILKLGEYLVDGVSIIATTGASVFTGSYDLVQKAYCGITGAQYSSTTKAMWANTMDFVEDDMVGELNDKFYNETSLGKFINENSALKYDSAGAKMIQNGTTKAAEIAAATAVTIATGGTAAPFVAAGLGFVEGTGKTGEEQFAAGNKNTKGVMLSYLGGVGKAAEWYGYGQVGGNVVNAVGKLGAAEAKTAVSNVSKEALEKTLNENLFKKALGKTFTTADVYFDTAAAGANAVSTKLTTGEWNAGEMALDFGLAIGGNVLGDVISGLADKKAARKTLDELTKTATDNVTINEFGEIIRPDGLDSHASGTFDSDIPMFTPPGDGDVGGFISGSDNGTDILTGATKADVSATSKGAIKIDDPGITLDMYGNPMKDSSLAKNVTVTLPMVDDPGATLDMFGNPMKNSSLAKNATVTLPLVDDPDATLDMFGNPMKDSSLAKNVTVTLPMIDDPGATLDMFGNPMKSKTVTAASGIPDSKSFVPNGSVAGKTNLASATSSSNAGSGFIRETNIPVDIAFEEIDNSVAIRDFSEIQKYGSTVEEALENINKQYGYYSPQAISARATVLQKKLDCTVNKPPCNFNNYNEVSKYISRNLDAVSGGRDFKIFYSEAECEQYFDEHLKFWSRSTTSGPKATPLGFDGMKSYTGSIYGKMNPYLREQSHTLHDDFRAQISELAGMLDQMEAKEDIILFRGLDNLNFLLKSYGIQEKTSVDSLLKVCGGTLALKDNAFLSTTPVLGRGFTSSLDVVEVIRFPAGTKGSYVGKLSTCSSEVEFLTQAGVGNRQILDAVERIGSQIFVYTTVIPK